MPGISRVKTWIGREVLVYSDLNDEFDNIINNLEAANVDGYSASVAQMRETADPGGIGTESLALRISDELKRIRFVLSRIVGKTYWYEAPARSLQTTYLNAGSYLEAGDYGNSSGASNTRTVIGALVKAGYDDPIADFLLATGVAKFSDTPASLSNPVSILGGRYFTLNGEQSGTEVGTISLWFKNFASGDTIFFNPLSGLRLYLNVNGFLRLDQEIATTLVEGVKTVYSITGNTSLSGDNSYKNVIIRFKYNQIPTTDAKVDLFLDGTLIGSISNNALPVNLPSPSMNRGIIFGKRRPQTAYSLTFPSGAWSAPAPWSESASGGTKSVANGVLTLTGTLATDSIYYSNTSMPSGFTDPQFFECKFKINSVTDQQKTIQNSVYDILWQNTSGAPKRGFYVRVNSKEIYFNASAGAIPNLPSSFPLLTIAHDFTEWTNLFVSVNASDVQVYINGQLKGSFAVPTDAGAPSDRIVFGRIPTQSTPGSVSIEYFIAGSVQGGLSQFVANSVNDQFVSDVCSIKSFVTDSAVLASLQTSSPFSLFGRVPKVNSLFNTRSFGTALSVSSVTPDQNLGTISEFLSDGETPVKINVVISCRNSVATAGLYKFRAYLTIIDELLTSTSLYENLANATLSNVIDNVSNLAHTVETNIPANIMQWDLPISTSVLLPAGRYSLKCVFEWVSTPAAVSVTVNRVKASVTN